MKDNRIAVLIDAENISSKYYEVMYKEIVNNGFITINKAYGDWSKDELKAWGDHLLEDAIVPIHKVAYASGKNSSDSALIIDAMDIIYSGKVDIVCICSSDSDFTGLALRIRQEAIKVIGFGENKTPKAFINACNEFKCLETLYEAGNKTEGKIITQDKRNVTKEIKDIVNEIKRMLNESEQSISLSGVGNMLKRITPDFDIRKYGYNKLSTFIESLEQFELRPRKDKDGNINYYVEEKKVKKKSTKKVKK